MADLISPDAGGFQRYTFTYKEHNWDEQHNENWTQTVEQLNQFHFDINGNPEDSEKPGLISEVGQLQQRLDILQGDLDELDSDSGKFIDFGDYGDDLDTQKIARLTSTAAVDAETLNITVLRADLKAGDEIIAYDLGAEADIANRVHLTVAQDTDQGANTLVVEALGEELKEGTILLPDPAFVVAQLRLLGGDQAQFSSKIARVEDELNAAKSSITQTADEIALAVQRISETEGLIAQQETAIRQTAEKIELFAVETIEDEVFDKIEHAESRIDINAQEIRLLNQRTTDHNGRLRQQASQIKINKDQISLASGQIETFENIVEGVRAEIKVENDRITSLVTDFEQLGDDVSFNASQITQLSNEIESIVVEQETNENTLLGTITNDLDAGSAVTTLNLDNTLDVELKEDDVLILEATGEDRLASDPLYIRVTVRQDVAKNANSVPIFEKFISNCPPGSPLHLPITTAMSRITQTADAINSTVTDLENDVSTLISQTTDRIYLGVEPDGDPSEYTFVDINGDPANSEITLQADRINIGNALQIEFDQIQFLDAVASKLGTLEITDQLTFTEPGAAIKGNDGWVLDANGFGVQTEDVLDPKGESAMYSVYNTSGEAIAGFGAVSAGSGLSNVTVQAQGPGSSLILESETKGIKMTAAEEVNLEAGMRFAHSPMVTPNGDSHIEGYPRRDDIRVRVGGSDVVDIKRIDTTHAPAGKVIILTASSSQTLQFWNETEAAENNIRIPDPSQDSMQTRSSVWLLSTGFGWDVIGGLY